MEILVRKNLTIDIFIDNNHFVENDDLMNAFMRMEENLTCKIVSLIRETSSSLNHEISSINGSISSLSREISSLN